MSVLGWRLYANSFSGYFPRSDLQIKKDMAGRYLMNIAAIFECIERKIRRKADEVARSAKMYGYMGTIATFALAPLAGGAALGLIVTEVVNVLRGEYDVDIDTADTSRTVIAFGRVLGGEIGAEADLAAGVTAIVLALLPEDMDPTTKAAVRAGVPLIVDAVVDEVTVGSPAGEAVSNGVVDVAALQALASGLIAIVVKVIVASIKEKGTNRVVDFYDDVLDLKNMPVKMLPFLIWCMQTLALEEVFEEAAQEAGLEGLTGNADKDILEPLRDPIREQGETVPDVVKGPEEVAAQRAAQAGVGLGAGLTALAVPTVLPSLFG